jgi:hypothetical protein
MKINTCILSVLFVGSVLAANSASLSDPKVVVTNTSAKAAKFFSAMGSVITVDMVGNTLAVQGKKKNQWLFSVPANAKILEGKKAIVLGDIIIGFKVSVKYTKEGDTLTASVIKVWPTKKPSVKPISK